ncbi:unnamed protein product [Amoebophrya sp. A25]|nr:unnamed protein product [Amoebophrya sp. A25]|eukprot:GSA25T00007047001.1
MSTYSALNATRARHLENALQLFETSRVSPDAFYPLDLFLRKYFRAHKHVKHDDKRFISEHIYELVKWRGLLDLVGGHPFRWHHRMQTYFISQRWKDQQLAARKITAAAKVGFSEELFGSIAKAVAFSASPGGGATASSEVLADTSIADLVEVDHQQHPFGSGRTPSSASTSSSRTRPNSVDPAVERKAQALCNVLSEKPVWFLRVNPLRKTRKEVYEALLAKEIPVEMCKHSDLGLLLHDGAAKSKLLTLPERHQGWFEFQDESSQLMAMEVQAQPGDKVLDYCSGSGGKALIYGPRMRNSGNIFLHDIRDTVLRDAKVRMRRAGIRNYSLLPPSHPTLETLLGKCDWVVVDAPNSAIGALRKNPDMKWSFSEDKLLAWVGKQRAIFESSLKYVKVGGKIVYMVNSFFPEECAKQVEYFCEKYNLYLSSEPKHALPQSKGLDGFFCAILEK